MKADTDDTDNETIHERVAQLERDLKRMDAVAKRQEAILNLLLGERELVDMDVQSHESLLTAIERLDDDLADAAERATGAQVAVQELSDQLDSPGSKQDEIRRAVRDRLVKRALLGQHDGSAMGYRLADFDDHTPPKQDVVYEQARRVSETLVERWPAFILDENGDGERVLRVSTPAIDTDLANRCERSLGRDDLANIVVSRERREGR